MNTSELPETVLRKDSEWSVIDAEPCRVVSFTPLASIENGKIIVPNKTEPYASILLECKKLSKPIKGFITHKIDFQHLWMAFKERKVNQNEEVIIFWSKKHLKSYAKFFSPFMPKLWVMVCQKGAFELLTDPSNRPELTGEARYLAEKPIEEWKPRVMK